MSNDDGRDTESIHHFDSKSTYIDPTRVGDQEIQSMNPFDHFWKPVTRQSEMMSWYFGIDQLDFVRKGNFGYNAYCRKTSMGYARCLRAFEFSRYLQARPKSYSISIPLKESFLYTRHLKGNLAWLNVEILQHSNGSSCSPAVFPVRRQHRRTQADFSFDFQPQNAAVNFQLGTEAFDTRFSSDSPLISYNRRADIWASYWPRDFGKQCDYRLQDCIYSDSRIDWPNALEIRKSRTSKAAVFISDCKAEWASMRTEFIEKLARVVAIDSYGKCTIPGTIKKEVDFLQIGKVWRAPGKMNKYDVKLAVTATYRFSFAFENNIMEDYITEKLFHALSSNTVVVALGAPNLDEVAPIEHGSWINALHFEQPEYLGEYINFLDDNEEHYQKWISARDNKIASKEFLLLQENSMWDQLEGENSLLCKCSKFIKLNAIE